jgi:hypothetical protein
LRRTDIRGTDLSRAVGLTQDQVGEACANEETRLPRGLQIGNCRSRVVVRVAPPAIPRPPAIPAPPVRHYAAND